VDDRPMVERAKALAIVMEGPAGRDDEDAVKRAYSKLVTLRSFGTELIAARDLADVLDGMHLCPHDQCEGLAANMMSRLAQRF
jgi:hypothetical protein